MTANGSSANNRSDRKMVKGLSKQSVAAVAAKTGRRYLFASLSTTTA